MANRQLIKLSRFNWDSLRILLENLRQPLFDSRKCISIFPSEFHLWIWSNFNVYIWYFTLLKYLFIDIFVMKIFFVFRYFFFFFIEWMWNVHYDLRCLGNLLSFYQHTFRCLLFFPLFPYEKFILVRPDEQHWKNI